MRAITAMCQGLALLLLFSAASVIGAPKINSHTVTVTGISAGGAMAVQFQVAHSASVRGAGIVAGIPWYCAQGALTDAFMCMDDPLTIDVNALNWEMNLTANSGNIDPIENLERHTVTLFSGLLDTVVDHGTMQQLQAQYQGLNVHHLKTYFDYPAEHAWITNYWGNSCETLGSPFINNCGLDFAGEFLRSAFTNMGIAWNNTRGHQIASNIKSFSQTAFGADSLLNSLDTTGYYYLPTRCHSSANSSCHVHISFHGCEQGYYAVGGLFVEGAGLNQWAESNDVIVIYPQATTNVLLDNPNGCFDWWGYAGSDYTAKTGAQISMFNNMIQHLVKHGSLPSA